MNLANGNLDTKTFVVRDAVAAAYKSEKMRLRFKNSVLSSWKITTSI
jgi:hypothetical protein